MKRIRVRVSPSGRISIPADVRRAMGLDAGGVVTMEMAGNDLLVRTLREGVARAQAHVSKVGGESDILWSDELIAERRREAAKE